MQRYGYASVLERFQLHLTLSGPLNTRDTTRLLNEVTPNVAELNSTTPLVLDRLCLFVESAPGQPFRRLVDQVMAS